MGVWKDKETRSWTYTVSHYGKRDIYERQIYTIKCEICNPNGQPTTQPPNAVPMSAARDAEATLP